MQLHQNELWVISYDETLSTIKIQWSENTTRMTDDDFKDALERFAGHAEEYQARHLLVDVQFFKHPVTAELGKWRDEKIIPRYHAVGIKKMAYVLGPEAPPTACSSVTAPGAEKRNIQDEVFSG